MKSCVKDAFRESFQYAEDKSVEGLELISQALRDKMESDSKFRNGPFHGFSAMGGMAIE
jgi:hypothetical protein